MHPRGLSAPTRRPQGGPAAAVLLCGTLALAACATPAPPPAAPTPAPAAPAAAMPALPHALLPVPASVQLTPGDSFRLTPATLILVPAGNAEAARVGEVLAGIVAAAGDSLQKPRVVDAAGPAPAGSIALVLAANAALGEEGYELVVTPERVTLTAAHPAGLFYGVQTIRQLLPALVEHRATIAGTLGRPIRLALPAGRIADAPRFAWRGLMLDVSRHFLPPQDVRRFIDLMALHKLNRLHLHLSDDQGWRVEIRSWPNLTRISGATAVGGAPGGFYTQAELAELVRYAAERFITVVPEFDMPGHTNAALHAYPELNCDGKAPPAYTSIRVGFSALCVESEVTYRFVDDLVREVGALTGPYFHIGGDEVEKLTHAQYNRFVERVEGIVRRHGKRMVGWGEIAPARLDASSIVQHWRRDSAAVHAARGGKVILSPAVKMYLDMKYDSATVLGHSWAAIIPVRTAYEWDPATYVAGVPESAILGVEAPLWAETTEDRQDYEYLIFPRLAGFAEMGWSPQAARGWEEYRLRLGAQAQRWALMGVNFYRSPQVPWRE